VVKSRIYNNINWRKSIKTGTKAFSTREKDRDAKKD